MTAGQPERTSASAPSPPVQGANLAGPDLHEWEIAPLDVKHMLDGKADFILLDCRTPEEHATARIAGSMLVPMNDLSSHLPRLSQHEERTIVVYCHHGRRSMMVTQALREQGFEDVRSMAGGIDRWSSEIDPSVPKY